MNDFVCPTLVDIRSAAAHIVPYAVVSPPVLRNDVLDEAAGASVGFKCEPIRNDTQHAALSTTEPSAKVRAQDNSTMLPELTGSFLRNC